jgi:hypothetical protein
MKPEDIDAERLKLELRLQLLVAQERASTDFLSFCQYVWPEMLVGEHHKRIAAAFDRVVTGECKRLIMEIGRAHV